MSRKLNRLKTKSLIVDYRFGCNSVKQKYIKRHRFSIFLYRQLHGCIYCGANNHLTFHHNHNKKNSVYKLVKNGIKQAWNEVYKCEVVCRNCHDKIHFNQLNQKEFFSPFWINCL